MRVLITNSLVLAAISLAPSASAAPYTATSSIDSYDSYPNSTIVAQDSSPSSVSNVRRDDDVHTESFYDASPFGMFKSFADLFGNVGLNAIADNVPLTEAQKIALGQLGFTSAVDGVVARLPVNPLLPHPSRSLEDPQLVNLLATLNSNPPLASAFVSLSRFLSSDGPGAGPTASLADLRKQVLEKIQTSISSAVEDGAAKAKLDLVHFSREPRSVEERSLGDLPSLFGQLPSLVSQLPSTVLSNIENIIHSLFASGIPLDDVHKEALAKLQDAIKAQVSTVHIEHSREEHGHWDHHDHEPHGDDRHSHEEHKHDHQPWDAHKDDNKPRDGHEDDHKPHGAHKDGHQPHDSHKDPNVHSADREGDRCREPRDGQRDERHKWDDCRHRKDGQGKDEDRSLLKISLGHHP